MSLDANISTKPEENELLSLIRNVASFCDSEDIVKMVFLFGDLLKPEENKTISNSPPKHYHSVLHHLIKLILERNRLNAAVAPNVLAEIIYFTKKYRFLKLLSTCKHLMKEQILSGMVLYSSEFRRFLVSLCDELTDEETSFIWKRLSKENGPAPKQPEYLFEWMLHQGVISQVDTRNIAVHFKVLERVDLLHKMELYMQKIERSRVPITIEYDLSPSESNGTCGKAYIFNFRFFNKAPDSASAQRQTQLKERNGTDHDATTLEQLWKTFGIKPYRFDNITRNRFREELKNLLSSDFSKTRILVICILSHGDHGVFYCSDSNPIKIADVEELLGTSDKLAGKPKLLFIQACQGQAVQKTNSYGQVAQSFKFDAPTTDEMPEVPQHSDMLIGMATVSGFMSIRNTTAGTFYIQSLVEVLQQFGDKEDISTLLVEVNGLVAQKRADYKQRNGIWMTVLQMPTYRNQLTKRLKFKRATIQTYI